MQRAFREQAAHRAQVFRSPLLVVIPVKLVRVERERLQDLTRRRRREPPAGASHGQLRPALEPEPP